MAAAVLGQAALELLRMAHVTGTTSHTDVWQDEMWKSQTRRAVGFLPSSSKTTRADTSIAPKAGQKETSSAFALFILIVLLMVALFTSYMLQQQRIQAVHETVLSIFAGEWE